jgi:hypothetical protein
MNVTHFATTALFLCVFTFGATSSYADSIALNSSASETTNDSGSPTVNIPPNPAWEAALPGSSWISYVQSGDPGAPDFVSPVNGTLVTFTDTFTIGGNPTGGSLSVLADDTTSVLLNGILVEPEAPTAGNTYSTCSDYPIGCISETIGTFDLSADLTPGVNILSFQVAQVAGSSYGLDYSGSVEFDAVPEPATLSLLSLPLFAFAIIRRMRKA